MSKRKAKIEITREQVLQNFLNKKYGNYNPQPTYSFKIGDAVTIGALEDVIICDVLENGIYEIDYTITDNNYGNPVKHTHQRRFVYWYEIRPINNNNNSYDYL